MSLIGSILKKLFGAAPKKHTSAFPTDEVWVEEAPGVRKANLSVAGALENSMNEIIFEPTASDTKVRYFRSGEYFPDIVPEENETIGRDVHSSVVEHLEVIAKCEKLAFGDRVLRVSLTKEDTQFGVKVTLKFED